MSSFGTVILLQIFPALLPPINEEDRDFYAILDLPQGASESEVRKAYKTKSLALHPDKVAQRRESAITAEQAAQEYQLVQEAHSCLSDKASRQKYHAVHCSPTRYRFLTQGGGLSNQMALLKNLSQASFADKTKLVLFVSTFPAFVLIQPILVAVKVNHILHQDGGLEDASWLALMIPWWLLHGLFVVFWTGVAVIAPAEAKLPVVSTALEQLLWLIAFVLLALRWDNIIDSNYAAIFVPVYLALAMKWVHTVMLMRQINADMAKMVSKNHFMEKILHGREPEELDEEELKELHEKYVVVSQIPADVEYELENDEEFKKMTEEEREEIRVSSSREFEAASEAYSDARRSIVKSMVLDVVFLVLVILKVDQHVDMSWWIVFIPILVSYGLKLLYSCFICCCLASPMDPDEIVVLSMKKEDLEKTDGDDDKPTTTDGDSAWVFPFDSEVELFGLKAEEFNGKTGVIKGPLKDGRQEVYIQELFKLAAIKVENMKSKTEQKADATPENTNGEDKQTKSKDEQAAASSTNDSKPAEGAKNDKTTNTSDADDATNGDDKKEENKQEGPTAASDNKEEKKESDEKKDDGGGDDDDISIHIDPETYRAYQSAYAAAEQNVMEDRMKAGQDNCFTTIKLIMVCLLIAKLEAAYDAIDERETEGDDEDVDVGFNTLWLIFPLFLIVGFMIFCCACLIYSAPDPEELMGKEGENAKQGDEEANAGGANEGEGNGETPIVFAPPPPEPTPAADEAPVVAPPSKEETKKPDEAKESDPEPPAVENEGDINDLD